MSYCEQSKEIVVRAHHVIAVNFTLGALGAPPDFYKIFYLNSSGLLRSILGNLGAPRHVRLLTYAKCAIHGLEKQPKMESGMSSQLEIVFLS